MSEAFLKCPLESFVESLGPCPLVGCTVGWSGSKPDFLLLFEWSPVLVLSIGLFFVAVQFFQESCELLLVSSARLVVFWVPSGVRGLRAIISLGTLTLPFCSHLGHCAHLIPLLQSKACGLQQSPRPKTWCHALNLIIRRGKFLWHDNQVLCDQKNNG